MDVVTDLKTLLLADTPLIDTRAPAEFRRGSPPTAISLPLMDDNERAQVGTCYKQQGQAAAIELGHQLVCGDVKQARVDVWEAQHRRQPETVLFCFRGGLRSQISQQWLAERGVDMPRVAGGYKALRSFLMETLERATQTLDFLVIGGPTGSAKTDFINTAAEGQPLPDSIDLEGLANHRGSAFGRRVGGQPSQIGFEMALAIEVLKREAAGHRRLILEDEGRLIGRCALPEAFLSTLKSAPLMLLECPFEARVEHSYHNYILANLQEQLRHTGDPTDPFDRFADGLRTALSNISKRLGGERYQALLKVLERALTAHRQHNDPSLHRDWIATLLRDYYDPMYEYQLRDRGKLVIARGSPDTLARQLLSGCAQSD